MLCEEFPGSEPGKEKAEKEPPRGERHAGHGKDQGQANEASEVDV